MQAQNPLHPLHDPAAVALAIKAARHRGQTVCRHIADPARDRDDHAQDILVDLLQRAVRFDASRGSWGAFVTIVTRHAAVDLLVRHAGRALIIANVPVDEIAGQQVNVETAAVLAIDARGLQQRLPLSLRRIADAIEEAGAVTAAQRASNLSAASFYRALRQLRLRVIAAGLAPPCAVGGHQAAVNH